MPGSLHLATLVLISETTFTRALPDLFDTDTKTAIPHYVRDNLMCILARLFDCHPERSEG